MLLFLNALAHLLVDGLCAATVFGPVRDAPGFTELVLLYNTLAFSTQCLVGLAADRIGRHGGGAAAAAIAVVLGFVLPVPAWLRICLIGAGNSLFHVAGGVMTLERSGGKAGPLGVFVAPGAVGLTLGTLWPQLGSLFAPLLVAFALAVILLEKAVPVKELPEHRGEPPIGLAIPLLLTLAVAVRAVGGCAVSFPWKTGALMALLMTAFVFAGKTAGGFLCDRLGPGKTALISIVPAAVLIAFCSAWAVPALAGQLLLNLTMPVTLWLLYRAMPDSPGFAFGLAAAALWPGTIAGGLMHLTGPLLWLCVIVSFVFGLGAILYAEKTLNRKGRLS